MTITEFLLARIAEDEARAHYALSRGDGGALEYGGQWYGAIKHAERWEPTRVLAECEAKRSLIGLLQSDSRDPHNAMRREWADEILRAFATVHADHPDYNVTWACRLT